MKRKELSSIKAVITLVPAAFFLIVALAPVFSTLAVKGVTDIFPIILSSLRSLLPVIILFLVNFIFLCPKYLFVKGKRKWFYIVNSAMILGWRAYMTIKSMRTEIPPEVTEALKNINLVYLKVYANLLNILVSCIVVGIAVVLRYIFQTFDLRYKLEVEKRNAAEAELSWLKNQLNPHFLFNVLNNISSLAVIDPDRAQESIAQLSNLLRYVLYESNKDFVPLSSEVGFIQDYIDLMKLRCNENTKVEVSIDIPSGGAVIAPMLFISLIENAFKHGVNTRMESRICVLMKAVGKDLEFRCTNSLFEKPKTDLSGSGIGLNNTSKRLELIYPDRHELTCGPEGDKYVAELKIKGIFS